MAKATGRNSEVKVSLRASETSHALVASAISEKRTAEEFRYSIDEYDDETLVAHVRELFASSTEGLTTDDAVRALARALGFARAGVRINERLSHTLMLAARRQVITQERGAYFLLTRSIADYTRDGLTEHLFAAIGRAWRERDEAIRLAARRMGFRRTGRRIQDALKSVINGALRRGLLEADGRTLIRRVSK